MSKGLDAIKEIRFDNLANQIFDGELKIIEEELKDYEELKADYRELEIYVKDLEEWNGQPFKASYKEQKKLKAFEIIKRKQVDVALLRFLLHFNPINARDLYNKEMLQKWNDLYLLNIEEYDLLKEVLL